MKMLYISLRYPGSALILQPLLRFTLVSNDQVYMNLYDQYDHGNGTGNHNGNGGDNDNGLDKSLSATQRLSFAIEH